MTGSPARPTRGKAARSRVPPGSLARIRGLRSPVKTLRPGSARENNGLMVITERSAFEFVGDWSGQFIATAIHNGHDVRPEVAAELILSDEDRLREEDPHTDEIGALVPARVVVRRS